MHRECAIRMTAGSIFHQLGRCRCFLGSMGEEEPDWLTQREGAILAAALYQKRDRAREEIETWLEEIRKTKFA